jgi:circadian clock protein KaiC
VELTSKNSPFEPTVRCSTGVEGLDDITSGGLIAHRLYLVDGNPGSGKTTLSVQFLREGVRLGERCLYITLSETARELRSSAASHGWVLDGIEIVELIANDEDLELEAQVTLFNPSEVELNETTAKILRAMEEFNPDRVVFDSLSELRLLSQSSLRYRRQILALKQFFLGRKCTVLMLDDRTTEGLDRQLQSIAHGVISMEQYVPAYGSSRRKLQIVKLRGSRFRGGFHDFNIETGGIEVFPRLIAAEHSEPFTERLLKSGIPSLDDLVGGGLDRGTSTLLLGPAGSGKSTIATQYIVAAANQGDKTVMFLFDESLATLLQRCDSLGIKLRTAIDDGQVVVRTLDPAEVSPGEFAHLVRKAVEFDGAKTILIDSLNGYLNAMTEELFLMAQMHELLSYLGRLGVNTFMVVAQHGMFGSPNMPAPVDTSYLADTVLLHRFFEYRGEVKKAISVVKKRSGSHEQSIRELSFDSHGIKLGEPLHQLRGILTGVPVDLNSGATGE